MNSWLKKLRLRWFLGTRALDFSTRFTERLFRIYLNHNKVIHFRDGHPVYSLSTPALYTGPAANMFARSVYRGIQNKNVPNLMSFALTDVCNAHCKHCSFYESIDDKSRTMLTLAQCRKLIADAQDLGVSIINFVGGEPLKRPELLEIIRSVDKDRSMTTLFTNGTSLAPMAKELRRAGLDGIYVSIDSADAAKHDDFRGVKGLFDLAIKGIEAARETGMSVGISCCITPDTFLDGEFHRIVELGKRVGVHEIAVFDGMPSGRFKHRADLVDNGDWIEEMITESVKYNEDWSYPGVLIHAYAASHRSVGCSCGTSYYYVTPYGDISSCDFNHQFFGNVLEEPLHEIWERMTSDPVYREAKWGGCKVKDSAFRERSGGEIPHASCRTEISALQPQGGSSKRGALS